MAEFLFFDVGGTLLHFAPSHAAVVAETLCTLGIDVPPELALDAVRAARRLHGGRPNPVDLDANREWWMGLFGQVLHELGGDPSGPLRDELYARHRAGDWLSPAADTVATLQTLASRGHRMAVISNWDDTIAPILERHGLAPYFEFLTCSSDIGAAKPDRRIFEAAIERAGIRPEQAVHIGDEFLADVRGACGVGIRPILIGTHAKVPDGESVETIETLAGLLDRLKK